MAMKIKPKGQGHRSHTVDEAIVEASKEDTKNVLTRLPESKHKALKIKAASNGQTIQEIVEDAIDRYLQD